MLTRGAKNNLQEELSGSGGRGIVNVSCRDPGSSWRFHGVQSGLDNSSVQKHPASSEEEKDICLRPIA